MDLNRRTMYSQIEAAIEDLKAGKMILITDDQNRENEADLMIASDDATPQAINFMATYGRGLICVSVEQQHAEKLNLSPMTVDSTDPMGTAFTVSIDSVNTTTGISAYDRSETIARLISTDDPTELRRPGHMFPLIAQSGGVLTRAGHTEASVDLAKLADKTASGVICEVMAEDGTMITGEKVFEFARNHDLKLITIASLIEYRKQNEQLIERQAKAKLPTAHGQFEIVGYLDKLTAKEHVALVKGPVNNCSELLVRVHSECLTGDGFGSVRCDCGQQLTKSMELIEQAGAGVIVYLRQEGRGIGLLNKIKAYTLQDEGLDTVEANLHLGFAADQREYYAAKQILEDLGVKSIKLLTNNPDKVTSLEDLGVVVSQRVSLIVEPHQESENYMQTKKEKMNHYL